MVTLGAESLRRGSRKHGGPKFILGDIQILNYDQAYKNKRVEAGPSTSGMEEENWVIVMKPEVTDDQIHTLCSSGKCLAEGHPDQGGVPYFEVRASESELETLLGRAKAEVKFVEPDGRFQLEPEVAELASDAPWGLTRIGTSQRPSRGAGTHIYILDSGIRKTHSDFGGRVIPTLDNTRLLNKECVSWSPLPCANDNDGHGTHCAGTAGGATYGVASEATLHAMKVLGDSGGGEWSWSIDALDFIATKGSRPSVASMSLGAYGRISSFEIAVNAVVEAGVVVIVAAGNENRDASEYTPSYIPSAITVGSTTSEDTKSSFSNYGEAVNIWAPGSDILSAGVTSNDASDTMSGTSMACPHVSGAAAVLLERDPSMNAAKVLAKLLANAVPNIIGRLLEGDTNSLLYVGAGGPPPTPIPTPAPTPVPSPVRTSCDEATSRKIGPNCLCNWESGLICMEGGRRGCIAKAGWNGEWDLHIHRLDCWDCVCVPDPIETM